MSRSTMKVAIYARVSTTDKGQDTTNQLRELRQYAEASGWTVYKEYVDHASGAGVERPQFDLMFADAAKKRFNVVLFWSLDRFTREGTLPTLQYLQALTKYGVAWKSHQEQYIDSLGPFSDIVIAIFATMAKMEKLRIGERTRAGMVTARLKGSQIGRPRIAIDSEHVLRLHREGHSTREVAAAVGVNRETVRKLIQGATA